MKKQAWFILLPTLALALAGCEVLSSSDNGTIITTSVESSSTSGSSASGSSDSATSGSSAGTSESSSASVSSSENSLDSSTSYDPDASVYLAFSGTSSVAITNNNGDVSTSSNYVYITGAGSYVLSGTATAVQVMVYAPDEEVNLYLNEVHLTSTKNSPLYIKKVDEIDLIAMAGTTNSFTDASTYTYEDTANEEPNAAIYSKDDAVIKGTGTITVTGNHNNGIHSSNDLRIKNTDGIGPTLNVTAVNNGLKGKDSVEIEGGTITVNTAVTGGAGDAIQADTEDDVDKGYVMISGGTITLTSSRDGIQGYRYVDISGVTIAITTGKGANYTVTDSESYKGIKSDLGINISGGTITVNAMDDSVHANGNIAISGGTLSLATGDDGVHSDATLAISGGNVTVTKSYEGLEAATLNIQGGTIHVTSSDDGLNAASDTSTPVLNISGGYLYVNASGDGLDSNGNIFITGGVTLVNGPTANDNGPLDCGDNGFYISQTGGVVIAVGSKGMAVGPTTGSQYSALIGHTSAVAANGQYVLTTGTGTPVLAFKPAKTSYSMMVSTTLFQAGAYKLYSGGTLTGATGGTDGYYLGGTSYTSGTQLASWTFSSSTVHYSTGVGGGGGGRP